MPNDKPESVEAVDAWYCSWCDEEIPEESLYIDKPHAMGHCDADGLVYVLDDPDADYEAVRIE